MPASATGTSEFEAREMRTWRLGSNAPRSKPRPAAFAAASVPAQPGAALPLPPRGPCMVGASLGGGITRPTGLVRPGRRDECLAAVCQVVHSLRRLVWSSCDGSPAPLPAHGRALASAFCALPSAVCLPSPLLLLPVVPFLRDVASRSLKAQACIIMFDLTARGSYLMVPEWHKRISRIAADIPTVLVGNKVDVKERMVKARQIRYHRRVGIPYFDISAKTNYNAVRPFLKIACILARDESLRFTEAPVLLPAEFQLNDDQKRALEADRVAADAAPLPEGDDFD